jgi:hypothetical protein
MENPFARKGIIDTICGWVLSKRKPSPSSHPVTNGFLTNGFRSKDRNEEPVAEIKWSLGLIADKVSGEQDSTWLLTNIYSKPFIVWGASHNGVCDGYQVSVLDKNRVVAPGESIELLTRHRVRTISLSCTEYDTSEDAVAAYERHRKDPKATDWKMEWTSAGLKPVFPYQECSLNLDYQAEPVLSDCHLSESYRPAVTVIEKIKESDKLHGRYGRSMFHFQEEN